MHYGYPDALDYKIKTLTYKDKECDKYQFDNNLPLTSYIITNKWYPELEILLKLEEKYFKEGESTLTGKVTLYRDRKSRRVFKDSMEDLKNLGIVKKLLVTLEETSHLCYSDKINYVDKLVSSNVKEDTKVITHEFSIKTDVSCFRKVLENYFTVLDINIGRLVNERWLVNKSLYGHFTIEKLVVNPFISYNKKKLINRKFSNREKYENDRFIVTVVIAGEYFNYRLRLDTDDYSETKLWELVSIEEPEVIENKKDFTLLDKINSLQYDLFNFIAGQGWWIRFNQDIEDKYGPLLIETHRVFMSKYKRTITSFHPTDLRCINSRLEREFILNECVKKYLKQLPSWNKVKDKWYNIQYRKKER